MEALQHAQRVISSAGCSTSGPGPASQHSRSTRPQLHGDCLHIHRHSLGLELRRTQGMRKVSSSSRKSHRLPTAVPCVRADVSDPIATEALGITKFVAETCLPTKTGKYRVRAYRHSVSTTTVGLLPLCMPLQPSAFPMACLPADRWWQDSHRTHMHHDWQTRGQRKRE